jgi:hypothetical protein
MQSDLEAGINIPNRHIGATNGFLSSSTADILLGARGREKKIPRHSNSDIRK